MKYATITLIIPRMTALSRGVRPSLTLLFGSAEKHAIDVKQAVDEIPVGPQSIWQTVEAPFRQ